MTRKVDANLDTKPQLAHFVLRVSDVEASIQWYAQVLRMEVVHRAGALCFLTHDEEHHRLALVETPVESATEGAPGLDHVAYTLASLGELLATYKRLRQLEILPVWPINHGLTTSLYYADPDGHRVEFQVENLATKQALADYMRSDAFAANPIGETFDPEELLARFEAGEPEAELLRIGFN